MEKKLKVLNMIGGIGSMTIGAKQQGWNVVGNIEWRPYYHTGTFEYNFPESFMVKTLKDLSEEQKEKCKDLDLIIGHTECGNFSNLRINKMEAIDAKNPGDIPEFIDAINTFKPKFFAMDNLPKSLMVCDYSHWGKELSDYDIHFEWINNHGYGNIQKNRKRLFVIGSKKELGFYFIPGEFNNITTVGEMLENVDELPNHNLPKEEDKCKRFSYYHFNQKGNGVASVKDLKEFLKNFDNNEVIIVKNQEGNDSKRIGEMKLSPNKFAPVLTKEPCIYHWDNRHLTIRERARISGAPDDFVFLPDEEYRFSSFNLLTKQTGKFMPVQFCSFLTQQIKDFLEGNRKEENYTQQRLIKSNEYIDLNKQKYCENITYSNQGKVCQFCGSKSSCHLND